MEFFCMVNGTPRNVPNMKFHVPGDECAIVGTWHDGKPYAPNKAAFRAALPYRWCAAFDREGEFVPFWHDRYAPQCRVNLADRRGRYLATIYCQPATR